MKLLPAKSQISKSFLKLIPVRIAKKVNTYPIELSLGVGGALVIFGCIFLKICGYHSLWLPFLW